MTDLVPARVDRLLSDLIASRDMPAGRTLDDVARDALASGRVWSPAQRAAYAAKVRAMSPPTLDDSTATVRDIREGR